jgi:hypothetical protein
MTQEISPVLHVGKDLPKWISSLQDGHVFCKRGGMYRRRTRNDVKEDILSTAGISNCGLVWVVNLDVVVCSTLCREESWR